jgi:dTMP kinase
MTEKGPSSGKRAKHEYPGKLIVLEGTDGVGRTTQAQLCCRAWLNVEGYGVTRTDWKSSQLMTRSDRQGQRKKRPQHHHLFSALRH